MNVYRCFSRPLYCSSSLSRKNNKSLHCLHRDAFISIGCWTDIVCEDLVEDPIHLNSSRPHSVAGGGIYIILECPSCGEKVIINATKQDLFGNFSEVLSQSFSRGDWDFVSRLPRSITPIPASVFVPMAMQWHDNNNSNNT